MPNVRITLKAHPVHPPKTTDPSPTPVSTVPTTDPTTPSTDTTTPTSITIAPTAPSTTVGTTVQETAVVSNTLGAVLTGTQPDGWHSSNTGVATVDLTGLVTPVAQGTAQITATLTTPSLTSNTSTVTVVPPPTSDGEPAFRSGTDTMRYQDDFTKYASAVEMWTDRNNGTLRFGQTDATGTPADQDPTGVLLLAPGRDGVTGKTVRFVYAGGILDESHELWLRNMPTLADPTIHVFQHWARITIAVPINQGGANSEWPIKWFMAWHRSDGVDAAFRNQWNTHNYLPGPVTNAPRGSMWENYDTAATTNQAHQPVPPYATEIVNSGTWHRFTYRYKPNTTPGSPSSRDGFSQMWLDGTKIIDVSLATVGITPPGGWKTWCEFDDLDALGSTTVNFLKIMGNFTTTDTSSFTVDWTEFAWWTQP